MTAPGRGRASVRGPNAERLARSRAALLAAGRAVFARDGFANAKTGEIVASAHLTRGALYYHFPDKTAMFEAVLEDVARDLVVRIDRAAASAGGDSAGASGDALTGLRAGCVEWLDAMAEPELHRLYLVEGPAALGLSRWRKIDAAHGGRALREGIVAVLGERDDPGLELESLTALLSGALNEAALWIAEADDPVAARQAMRTSLDTLLNRLFGGPVAG